MEGSGVLAWLGAGIALVIVVFWTARWMRPHAGRSRPTDASTRIDRPSLGSSGSTLPLRPPRSLGADSLPPFPRTVGKGFKVRASDDTEFIVWAENLARATASATRRLEMLKPGVRVVSVEIVPDHPTE